ncbi:hypothetical protein [Streptomyces sp. NPDC012510]|uniref:hypothetical protein n=1 Tax=Streptomyces sp. NPDC012510 TaxID=3364838 RepID=UPI0036E4955D
MNTVAAAQRFVGAWQWAWAVRFDSVGLAVQTRDYWHVIPLHREPARPLFLL